MMDERDRRTKGTDPGKQYGPNLSSGPSQSDFQFTSIKPGKIPGSEEMPRMEFVPQGMEYAMPRVPTRKDLEPLREVAVTPLDYLHTKEERSLFISRIRFHIGKLPFTNTNIFILQVAAIIALYITIAVNFYINPPESSLMEEIEGFQEFLLWNSSLGASLIAISFGTIMGGLGAYAKGLNLKTKTRISMYLMQIIAGSIVFITIFFIIIPFFEIESFYFIRLDYNNLEIFMRFVIIPSIYLTFLLMFSAAVILGVYGLLTGSTGPISMSTALIFLQITLALNAFSIETEDLYNMFMEESRIAIFSIAYLAYVELSFAVSKFAIDWRRTTRYDHRTGETTFTNLLGHTINLYIIFFIGIIIATFFMALFSTNIDWLFTRFFTPAMEDSIEHSTILGKVLFTLIFFGIIGLAKGIIPVKEYIEGRMNVSDEEVVIPMTIVEESEQRATMYTGQNGYNDYYR